MVTAEQNRLLTETGPGTAGGKLLRQYWQPIAKSSDLPEGSAPVPIRIMSEELVMFRDDQGRVGLLGRLCSHRRTDLSYGRIENGGLRCLYHGWLYDIQGHCLDQPAEPEHSTLKCEVKHKAYPCREVSGLIFTYMGEGAPPVLPDYEFLRYDENHRMLSKVYMAAGDRGQHRPLASVVSASAGSRHRRARRARQLAIGGFVLPRRYAADAGI
jgi:phthalate 4,5-dioxygenase oxygenase subunit